VQQRNPFLLPIIGAIDQTDGAVYQGQQEKMHYTEIHYMRLKQRTEKHPWE